MVGPAERDSLLYIARRDEPGLWSVPITEEGQAAGPEQQVLDRLAPVDWGNWAFVGEDLLFVDRSSGTLRLVRYHLRDGSVTPLPFDVGDVARGEVALAASGDSRHLLLARIAYVESDLMLVEQLAPR